MLSSSVSHSFFDDLGVVEICFFENKAGVLPINFVEIWC